MARRATDMLDVFRAEHPAPGDGARSKERAAPAKRGFSGLVLLPRQILLCSAVVLLLLTFTFVLGLSVGRRDGSGDVAGGAGGQSLSRDNPRGPQARLIYVEARVPYMDPARHVANDPATLVENLVRTRGVSRDHIWITDDIAAQRLRVLIGPFPGSEEGVEYLRKSGLLTYKLGGVLPWKNPDYPAYTPAELPVSRLPRR